MKIMSKTKLLFALFALALATLTVRAYNSEDRDTDDVKFYELKKGNLRVNFTNFGARIVSLNVPDKFGNVADIVLGYDSVDAYQEDKHSFGAIVGRLTHRLDKREDKLNSYDGNGGGAGLSKAIWKVLKHDKSGKTPFITFQYDSHDNDDDEEEDEDEGTGNLIITATYLLSSKNRLQITLYAKAKDEATSVNLAQNTYWNLGGHNSSGDILHDDLQVVASSYRKLDNNLVPTGRILPVEGTPYDFKHFHSIKSRFHKLKNGYEVDYVLDHQPERKVKDGMELAAVLDNKKSGRVIKVWTDEAFLRFSTGDEVRNVRGKGGVLYQKNAGVVLSAQGYSGSHGKDVIITKQKPYSQSTLFQFLVKK